MKSKKNFLDVDNLSLEERRERLDLRIDYVMKYVFFRWTTESKQCLSFLLEAMLEDMKVHQLNELKEGDFTGTSVDAKMLVDGACRVNGKHIIIVEMQKDRNKDDFDRFVRYGCGIVQFRGRMAENYDEGMNLVIALIAYPLPKGMKNHTSPYMYYRTDHGDPVSKIHMILIVELAGLEPLLSKDAKALTKKERYCVWLAYGHEPKHREEMKKFIELEEGLKMGEQALLGISNEKKIFTEIMLGIQEELEMQRKRHEKELEKENREKDELIKEQQYIIQLMKLGLPFEEAEQKARMKFHPSY